MIYGKIIRVATIIVLSLHVTATFGQSSIPKMEFYKYKPSYQSGANELLEQMLLDDRSAPSCLDLITYVTKKGVHIGQVGNFQLLTSSWLKTIDAFEYNSSIIVVAVVKRDQFSTETKPYIFCNVPKANWREFKEIPLPVGKTYGEKFHIFIRDYKCNCN